MGGGLTSQAAIASDFTLEHEHTGADGERWYKVLAENRITLGGGGELTGATEDSTVTYRLGLDGAGTSHNPWRAGDEPIVESRIITPYRRRPSHTAGQLRLYVREGRPHYDLRLDVNPIAPGFTWMRRNEMACPTGGRGVVTESYDNGTRAVTVQKATPSGASSTPPRRDRTTRRTCSARSPRTGSRTTRPPARTRW